MLRERPRQWYHTPGCADEPGSRHGNRRDQASQGPPPNEIPERPEVRTMTAVSGTVAILGLSFAAGIDVGRAAWGTGDWIGRFSLSWGLGFLAFALVVLLVNLLVLSAIWLPGRLGEALLKTGQGLSRLEALRVPATTALVLLPGLLVYYTPVGSLFPSLWVRAFLLVACIVLATLLGCGTQSEARFPRFATVALGTGAALVLAREFSTVTDYPFSLSWSEGNRLWDYSLMFGRDRYIVRPGEEVSAYISPGRQVLWGLVFLVPGASIVLVRLWNAFLLTAPYALLGWLAVRGEKRPRDFPLMMTFMAWSLLFLSQGPIYTPLILCAIIVALAVRLRHAGLGALLVAAASYYAFVSRWTWMLAPGIWGALLSILREPLVVAGGWRWRGFRRAAAFALAGVAGGWVVPVTIAQLGQGSSSAVVDVSAALTRQPLLWYRLLPNPTYSPGIALGLVLAAGPVMAAWTWLWRRRAWKLDLWQLAALLAVLVGFLTAGLVASAKIGGGSNLHNLDMFLTTVVLVAATIVRQPEGRASVDLLLKEPTGRRLTTLALVVPMLLVISGGGPLDLPSQEVAQQALALIRKEVREASRAGEVLFYDQRQLLTFGFVQDVPLVPAYEKKYMADQALAGDLSFFEPFYTDLARHRFSLIVSPPLETTWQEDHPFSEEDEAQVRFLYLPMAEHYAPVVRLDAVGVWLLRPRGGEGQEGP